MALCLRYIILFSSLFTVAECYYTLTNLWHNLLFYLPVATLRFHGYRAPPNSYQKIDCVKDYQHSGDGGIHGQLLQNNGFQGPNITLVAYDAIGDATLAVDTENPLSTAITRSLKVSVPEGASGEVGFSNAGYWGIPVNEDEYWNSFYIKGDYTGPITLRLVGAASGTVYASNTINVVSNSSEFSYIETKYTANQAPDGNNLWTLTFNASSVAGSELYFDLFQLFHSTFNNR